MKLEKTFHDEIQQILKLGSAIKVIPWTARASSRSKMHHFKSNYANVFCRDDKYVSSGKN